MLKFIMVDLVILGLRKSFVEGGIVGEYISEGEIVIRR